MGFWSKFKSKRNEKEVQSDEHKIIKNTEKEINVESEEIKLENAKQLDDKQLKKQTKKKAKLKQKENKAQKAMMKSALSFSKDIKKLANQYKQADDDFFEELEEVLIHTDMGMKLVLNISNNLQKHVSKDASFDVIKEQLSNEIYNIYHDRKDVEDLNYKDGRLNIFMIVGVNGTGKTTSIAKLAAYYAIQGKKVLIAAGDTFRAGAVEQLEEWVSSRLTNVDLFKGRKSQDPSSVIYDAIKQANDKGYDLLLIDTAGRLQNKVNLMQELNKVYGTIHKFDKLAPHETLLVIDATTGQNGVIQAKEFSQAAKVSGIILTKMDGTSKGGVALAIKNDLNIPVKFLGVGEQMDDLIKFDVDDYIYNLVSGFMEENGEQENDQ